MSIDFDGLKKLTEHAISGGVDYLVVLGTTGESPVFSWKEKLDILDCISEANNGRKPLVFGHGGNNTLDLIKKVKDLSSFELSGFLSVSPYYSRPSQAGIVRHFQMLADAFHKPVILYNIPARTGSNMEPETVAALSAHDNIIGVKEASGDFEQQKKVLEMTGGTFPVLSGDDAHTLNLLEAGAHGVISVIANIQPEEFTTMVNAALNGDLDTASQINNELGKCYELLSQEGNPSSLKSGLSVLGICNDTVRPPLMEGSALLKEAWERYFAVKAV